MGRVGFFARFRRGLRGLFRRKKGAAIGIYGAPNAGKTQLANTMCRDWAGDVSGSASWMRDRDGSGGGVYGSASWMRDRDGSGGGVYGSVSAVPHETRHTVMREQVTLRGQDGTEVVLDVMDTPGISSNVSVVELEALYGMSEKEAAARAEEAMNGMIEALQAVDSLTGVLLVVDATTDPLAQVNRVLLANIRARNVKVIVVANKIDLPTADVERVREVFRRFPVVPVSALRGDRLDELYDVIISEFG